MSRCELHVKGMVSVHLSPEYVSFLPIADLNSVLIALLVLTLCLILYFFFSPSLLVTLFMFSTARKIWMISGRYEFDKGL